MEAQAPVEHRPGGMVRVPAGDPEIDPDPLVLRIAALEKRIESLEVAIRQGVPEDLARIAGDLRHAVSELGRLLLRDLERLTKVLAEHRDLIIDRLSPAAGSAPPAAAAGSAPPAAAFEPPAPVPPAPPTEPAPAAPTGD